VPVKNFSFYNQTNKPTNRQLTNKPISKKAKKQKSKKAKKQKSKQTFLSVGMTRLREVCLLV
jgi:hypothetical protein